MNRKLFGTDGIRGLANRGDMTPEVAFRIGAVNSSHVCSSSSPDDGRPRLVWNAFS